MNCRQSTKERTGGQATYDGADAKARPVSGEPDERALLMGMPLVHLRSAAEICERHGRVVLPAGGPGDLDRTAQGATVLLMASDAGDDEVSAATWSARFVGRVHHEPGDPLPTMLPASWVETHAADEPPPPAEPARRGGRGRGRRRGRERKPSVRSRSSWWRTSASSPCRSGSSPTSSSASNAAGDERSSRGFPPSSDLPPDRRSRLPVELA